MEKSKRTRKPGIKLRYEKTADSMYSVDLHNGYTISAIVKFISREDGADKRTYHVSFWLNRSDIQKMSLMCKLADNTDLENIEFVETPRNLPMAILNYIYTLRREHVIDKYIELYEYEDKCFNVGCFAMESDVVTA